MDLQDREIPDKIKKLLQGKAYCPDKVGMSGANVICFDDMVLKLEETCESAENEHRMLKWLAGRLPVPEVLCFVQEKNTNYLLMSRMEGEMSCAEQYMQSPAELVRALAEGLKLLWKVDISDCPYKNTLDNKLRLAAERVNAGECNMEDVEPDTYGENGFESPQALMCWLKENRPEEEVVFSHGDYCLPNIFLRDGHISGFIDLGNCGVADRYQDIALCYRSLLHNFSGKYGGMVYEGFSPEMLFEELGITPDWNKIRYYILLDELF